MASIGSSYSHKRLSLPSSLYTSFYLSLCLRVPPFCTLVVNSSFWIRLSACSSESKELDRAPFIPRNSSDLSLLMDLPVLYLRVSHHFISSLVLALSLLPKPVIQK